MDAIGIDVGSTNVKAVRVDEGGLLLRCAQRPLRWTGAGAVAEQDGEALWQAVLDTIAEVAAPDARNGHAVGSIGVCGQYSSIIPVDARFHPLAPMRLYLDQRGTAHCRSVLAEHADAFTTWLERHPIPPIGGGLALGHLLAFQRDEPAIHADARAYLEPVDYVTARLTGELHATQGSMFASQLIDNRSLTATGYDPDLVAMAGIDPSRLPPLVPAGTVVGSVLGDVAQLTGLGSEVAVVAGLTDSCGQSLATGAHRPGQVGVVIGTTGVVLSTADHMGMDLDHEVVTMPGADTDRYLVSAENGIAGRAVEHILGSVLGSADGHGPGAVGDPFAGFADALAASEPGAGGVLFLPWLSGSMSPQADASVRGGFLGVSLDTERHDLVRAMAEGVAHNLRWLLSPVETFTGDATQHVILTGGAARSASWAQVVADVLERPVRTVAEPGHSGAQAVGRWAAAVVAGSVADVEVAVPLGAAFEPDEALAPRHRVMADRFVAVFEALRPLGLGAPVDPEAPSR
jgi:xylulokinase